jgi:hypothetical protein
LHVNQTKGDRIVGSLMLGGLILGGLILGGLRTVLAFLTADAILIIVRVFDRPRDLRLGSLLAEFS